jgi:ABC-type xylose transport system permease subunit
MMMTTLGQAALVAAQAGGEGGGGPSGELRHMAAAFFASGTVLSIVAAVFACGLALLLVTVFLVPGITQRGAEQAQASPYRAFLVGVAAAVVLILLVAATSRAHGLAIITVPLIVLVGLGGLTVIAHDLGRRVFALAGRSGSRFGRILAGWAIFVFAAVTPYLGWIVIGPVLMTYGIGGFLLSLFTRNAGSKPTPEVLVAANPAPAAPPPEGTA